MIVEKNVDIPTNANKSYPFNKMEVGDSIFIAGEKTCRGKCYIAAKAYGKYHGIKFTGRSVDGGVRIWRTA
jgi:hypothetical protein